MVHYSDELIEEIRQRNDIVDVIASSVSLKKKGNDWYGLCPFHNEKTPSFSVSRKKQIYYCFGCGAGGNVYSFLMNYENLSFPEAVQTLADRAGIALPKQEVSSEERQTEDEKSILLKIQKEAAVLYYRQLKGERGRPGYTYLRDRGLTDETIVKFGLGYADKYGDRLRTHMKEKGYKDELLMKSGLFVMDERRGMRDKFWNRVMFPIMDVRSRVIGFGGRVMGDGKPKYLNSPETVLFDKSRNLYGLNYAKNSRKNNLILCEGYMDVIAMHQAGFTNAVASLGTALTSQQCGLIRRYVNEALLLYDSDAAGQRAALRAIPMLREAGITAKVIRLAPYKDPDEFIRAEGAEAFEHRLANGRNGFLFQVDAAAQEYDRSDPQGQTEFWHRVAAMLMEFDDEIQRNSYLEAAAQDYHADPEMLRRLVRRLAVNRPVRTVQKLPSQTENRKKKQDGYASAQCLLLAWMAERPDCIGRVLEYLDAEDFTDPQYRRMAETIIAQYREGAVSPVRVLGMFETDEERSRAAAVFATQLPDDKTGRRMLNELILRVKENSVANRTGQLDPADMQGLMRMMDEKKKLENLRGRMKIYGDGRNEIQ